MTDLDRLAQAEAEAARMLPPEEQARIRACPNFARPWHGLAGALACSRTCWAARPKVEKIADLDRLAQAAHAAYLPGNRHAPEAHPQPEHEPGCWECDQKRGTRCCDPRLRAWPDLAEPDREAFRRQMQPALAVLEKAHALLATYREEVAELDARGASLRVERDEWRARAEAMLAAARRIAEQTGDSLCKCGSCADTDIIDAARDVLAAVERAYAKEGK